MPDFRGVDSMPVRMFVGSQQVVNRSPSSSFRAVRVPPCLAIMASFGVRPEPKRFDDFRRSHPRRLGGGSQIVYLEFGNVAHTSEPDLEALELCLSDGLVGSELTDARAALGLDGGSTDTDVARAMITALAARDVGHIGTGSVHPDAARHPSVRPPTEVQMDASFLGRLSASGTGDLSLEQIEDVATLLAVLRAGSRGQRRAALVRIRERIRDRRLLHSDTARRAIETIRELRDVELGYELTLAREELPGGLGREARGEREQWKRLAQRVEADIRSFWDGQSNVEPIHVLPGDQRALLLLRVRELPDVVANHISAVIEGSDGVAPRESRIGLLASLRYATDCRLVPSLVSIVEAERGELVAQAARVLGGMDDARAHPALAERFERSFAPEERLALAGALGMHGDCRGLAEVRGSLEEKRPQLLLQALEAMESLGTSEHTDLVARFIEHPDVVVATQAARTAGRIGDGRALDELTQRYDQSLVPALRAAIEDALSAVAARMELRGEKAAMVDWSEVGNKPTLTIGSRDSAAAIALGWRDYALGRFWLLFGRAAWAVARFESAATRRRGWVDPLIGIGMAFAQQEQYALALPAFRRALEIDRPRIERNPILVRAMAKSFLHRAEEVEREGRDDVARGLVGEVLTLDLRRAPGTVRFELKRKHDVLRREERGDVHSAA